MYFHQSIVTLLAAGALVAAAGVPRAEAGYVKNNHIVQSRLLTDKDFPSVSGIPARAPSVRMPTKRVLTAQTLRAAISKSRPSLALAYCSQTTTSRSASEPRMTISALPRPTRANISMGHDTMLVARPTVARASFVSNCVRIGLIQRSGLAVLL